MPPTTTTDFSGFLNPAQSAPIFDEAARQSVVQRLARRVPLGANGQVIPITTSKPTANWVNEGGQKPVSAGGRGLATIAPKKLAAIVVNSAEVVRADPGGYITSLRSDLAEAFAIAFDLAALHNVGGDGTGTGPFDNYMAETTKAVELGTAPQASGGIHADLVAGLDLLVNDGKRLTGFALDDVTEPTFWGSVDSTGRPLYVSLDTDEASDTLARPGRLLNRPSFMSEGIQLVPGAASTAYPVAFGGDFRKVAWGVVGGISYDVSDQATVTIDGTLTSLWEHNLVAIRAEAEYGLVIADTEAFVAYTQTTPAA